MLVLKYDLKEQLECKPKVRECCEPEKPPVVPPTGQTDDCCYEKWTREFKDIDADYNRAERTVAYLNERLTHLNTQRDMWKTWKTELDKACEYSIKICSQLEILLHQTSGISRYTWLTKRAATLLYCMIRDFYMQIDFLKKRYDALVNCIVSQKNPAFVSGQGLMALIEDYGKKLDAVIATRDSLLKLIISAISCANGINKGIGHHGHNFGLHSILHEWKNVFNCNGNHQQDDDDDNDDDGDGRGTYRQNRANISRKMPEGEFEDIGLQPSFKFPICDSKYYHRVNHIYQRDTERLNELTSEIMNETKNRDTLKAKRDGLNAIMNDPNVNPSTRCSTK